MVGADLNASSRHPASARTLSSSTDTLVYSVVLESVDAIKSRLSESSQTWANSNNLRPGAVPLLRFWYSDCSLLPRLVRRPMLSLTRPSAHRFCGHRRRSSESRSRHHRGYRRRAYCRSLRQASLDIAHPFSRLALASSLSCKKSPSRPILLSWIHEASRVSGGPRHRRELSACRSSAG